MLDRLVRPLGVRVLGLLRYVVALWRVLVRALSAGVRSEGRTVVHRAIVSQIYFTGVDAVFIVLMFATGMGGLVILQALVMFSATGNHDVLGGLLRLVLFRELVPVGTALIVIGRSGGPIAVDLANARVAGEHDLLSMMGLDLDRYLLWPRIVGVVVSTVALTLVYAVGAVLGGFVVSSLVTETPFAEYFRLVGVSVLPSDFLLAGVKALVFGTLIGLVSTMQGTGVGRVVTDVPGAVQRSVVQSLRMVLAADLLLTAAFWWAL